MKKDNIKLNGHIGTWYILSDSVIMGKHLYLVEHETYGEDTEGLIIDNNYNVVLDEVFNGWHDLHDILNDSISPSYFTLMQKLEKAN